MDRPSWFPNTQVNENQNEANVQNRLVLFKLLFNVVVLTVVRGQEKYGHSFN